MNKKNILVLTCVAWTATYQAFDAQKQIGAFTYLNQRVNESKNIFDDENLIDAIQRRISDTNTWVDNALKAHKSDTLKGAYMQINKPVNKINWNLQLLSSNLSIIKNNDILEKMKTWIREVSPNRDELKKQVQPGSTLYTFKKHKAPMLRSDKREAAKQEIADVLIAYAKTFANIAQKAINDFARIDFDLFQQEKKSKMFTVVPSSDSDMLRNTGNTDLTNVRPLDDSLEMYPYQVQRALRDTQPKKESELLKTDMSAYDPDAE